MREIPETLEISVESPWGFGAQRRWGYNAAKGTADYGKRGLKEMCDYGASAVRNGTHDALEFSVMADEAEFVEAYMTRQHPDVRFRFASLAAR